MTWAQLFTFFKLSISLTQVTRIDSYLESATNSYTRACTDAAGDVNIPRYQWWGLSFLDICLTVEENPRKKLNQENWPYRGLNTGPLSERQRCYPSSTAVVCMNVGLCVFVCVSVCVCLCASERARAPLFAPLCACIHSCLSVCLSVCMYVCMYKYCTGNKIQYWNFVEQLKGLFQKWLFSMKSNFSQKRNFKYFFVILR